MISDALTITKFNSRNWVLNIHERNILINENTYRLVEILRQAPGIKDAHQMFQQQFDTELSQGDFEKLIDEKLGKYNILAGNMGLYPAPPKADFLKYRWKLVSARLAGQLAVPFVPLFHPRIFYVALTAVIVYLVQAFSLHELKQVTFALADPALLAALLVPNIFLHEIGHIAACRQFSVKHGEIGVGLYLVFPVLYADVTQIWSLSKGRRIIVNLAGIFNQLLYTSALLAVYLVTANSTFFYASSIVLLSAIVQLNPFIRMDGYWILSDLTETSNLLPRANNLLIKFFKKKFLSRFAAGPLRMIKKAQLSSLILFGYAILNYSFITFYFAWAISKYSQQIIYFPVTLYDLVIKLFMQRLTWSDWRQEYTVIIVLYIFAYSIARRIWIAMRSKDNLGT